MFLIAMGAAIHARAEEFNRAINLTRKKELKMFNIGDPVTYIDGIGQKEKGRVKSFSDDQHVFVVYHCANDWNNYQNYTGVRTEIKDLVSGWEEV